MMALSILRNHKLLLYTFLPSRRQGRKPELDKDDSNDGADLSPMALQLTNAGHGTEDE